MLKRLFREKLSIAYSALTKSHVILSMPKTGSSKGEAALKCLHLHTVFPQKTTLYSPGLGSDPASTLLKYAYSFVIQSLLARRKRTYIVFSRNEESRLVSSFFQDFYFCISKLVLLGEIDSRQLSPDDFLKVFDLSVDYNYRDEWILRTSGFFKLESDIFRSLLIQGEEAPITHVSKLGTIHFVPIGTGMTLNSQGLITFIQRDSTKVNASESKFYSLLYKEFAERMLRHVRQSKAAPHNRGSLNH